MYTISKEFTFDAAHRLIKGYKGRCKNVHGHTYKVVITVCCQHLDLNKFGFVEDFSELKKLKEWVDKHWDHAMLVNNEDVKMIEFLQKNKQRYYTFASNPTAEVMAKILYDLAYRMIETDRIGIGKIRVYETPTSYAEYINVDRL